jgi:hypothetical protein
MRSADTVVAWAGRNAIAPGSAFASSRQPGRCRGIALVEVLVAILLAALAVTTGLGLALRGLDWTAVTPGAPCVGACSPDALAAAELGEWRREAIARLPDAAVDLQAAAGGALVVVVRWSGRGEEPSELRLGVQP